MTRTSDGHPELRAGDEIGAAPVDDAPASEPSIQAPKNPVAAELVSDLLAFARSNPDVADWILRYAESRHATLGESGAGAVEEQRRVEEEKIGKG